jgi:arginyl-tRNA synthetase
MWFEREFYVNDAGHQVTSCRLPRGKVRQVLGQEAELRRRATRAEYLVDMARDLQASHGDSLLSMPDKERHEFLKKHALETIIADQRETLLAYGLKSIPGSRRSRFATRDRT